MPSSTSNQLNPQVLQALAQLALETGGAGITPTIGAALGHPDMAGPYSGTTSGQKAYQTGDMINPDGTVAGAGNQSGDMFSALSSQLSQPSPDNAMAGVPKMNPQDMVAFRGGNADTRQNILGMYDEQGHVGQHDGNGGGNWKSLFENERAKAMMQSLPPEELEPEKFIYSPIPAGEHYNPQTDVIIEDAKPHYVQDSEGGQQTVNTVIHRKTANPIHAQWEQSQHERAKQLMAGGVTGGNGFDDVHRMNLFNAENAAKKEAEDAKFSREARVKALGFAGGDTTKADGMLNWLNPPPTGSDMVPMGMGDQIDTGLSDLHSEASNPMAGALPQPRSVEEALQMAKSNPKYAHKTPQEIAAAFYASQGQ